MSVITILKEADLLILSVDSRAMTFDHSSVLSDEEPKIFQIASNTFIATSGRQKVCDFQAVRARKLAIELNTIDIQAIARSLESESLPLLMAIKEQLPRLFVGVPDEETGRQISGESMIHGSILVGWSDGKLGFVCQTYWVQPDGTIKCTTETYFDAPRYLQAISGTPAAVMAQIGQRFMRDAATWSDPPEEVSMRFLEALKRSTPWIGGAYRILRLDASGAHWISDPPVEAGVLNVN